MFKSGTNARRTPLIDVSGIEKGVLGISDTISTLCDLLRERYNADATHVGFESSSMSIDDTVWLRVTTAAEQFGTTYGTIHKRCDEGSVRCIKYGNKALLVHSGDCQVVWG